MICVFKGNQLSSFNSCYLGGKSSLVVKYITTVALYLTWDHGRCVCYQIERGSSTLLQDIDRISKGNLSLDQQM